MQVNGQFVDWGAYSADHKYCTTMTLADGATLNLAVFDGHSAEGTPGRAAGHKGTVQGEMTP